MISAIGATLPAAYARVPTVTTATDTYSAPTGTTLIATLRLKSRSVCLNSSATLETFS